MQNKLTLVALGANLSSLAGAPDQTLKAALMRLIRPEIRLIAISRLWKTPAFPKGSGPDYVNAAAVLSTALPPEQLLAILHEVEAGLGRVRDGGRWQSRGIDLDLLAVGDAVLPSPEVQDHWRFLPVETQARIAPEQLILPHPRLADRGFVLAPLAEIAPDWVHPRSGDSVSQMLAKLPPDALADLKPMGALQMGQLA